jgi:transposase-like protein
VKDITEELCGHSFSASSISAVINKGLDEALTAFAERHGTWKSRIPYLRHQ